MEEGCYDIAKDIAKIIKNRVEGWKDADKDKYSELRILTLAFGELFEKKYPYIESVEQGITKEEFKEWCGVK